MVARDGQIRRGRNCDCAACPQGEGHGWPESINRRHADFQDDGEPCSARASRRPWTSFRGDDRTVVPDPKKPACPYSARAERTGRSNSPPVWVHSCATSDSCQNTRQTPRVRTYLPSRRPTRVSRDRSAPPGRSQSVNALPGDTKAEIKSFRRTSGGGRRSFIEASMARCIRASSHSVSATVTLRHFPQIDRMGLDAP